MKKTALFFALAVFVTLPAIAHTEDAEGCKDSPVLSRQPKCRISECETKDFDEAEVITGPAAEGDFKKQHLEGAKSRITYACDASVSFLNVARNAEAALRRDGFTIVFSGKALNERPAVTAHKGGTWVAIQTDYNGSEPAYEQIVVQTKQMEETMAASAEEFESEIEKTGSCSIYGILFDTGKATIQASSAKCLDEVAKLLKKNADWKMQIEGHTDNVGGAAANLKLSQQRADAVRAWLVAHGVEGGRLTAKGLGETKPVAENTTEDGRAKNRRVALVKL
jgi:outer membrane protein OmpA-like peptidoglycan-associated protein